MFSFNCKKNFSGGRINVPLLYFHRYLRLTPLMAASVLLSMSLMRFIGNGPVWPLAMDYLRQSCKRYWWSTLLYVQNYLNPDDIVSESNQ